MRRRRDLRGRAIQHRIGQILLRDWDPIGVRDIPEAQDEYSGYVGRIYRLLVSGASEAEIAEHLARIERESMGLAIPDHAYTLAIAGKLAALDLSLDPVTDN